MKFKDYKLLKLNEGNVKDIFFNDFDITWMQGPDKPRRDYSILPIENAKDDGEVSYFYNEDFFRCDNFKKEHNGNHILFAGCSNTEGVGSPLETVWSKMLYNELATKYKMDGFYSIARSGYGWQKIISNFMIYTQKYGFPSHLFVLLPNITRFYIWENETRGWQYVQRYPEDKRNHVTENEYFEKFIDFIISWRLFEKYCEDNNVKLIWSTWFEIDEHNLKIANQSRSFFDMDKNGFLTNFVKVKRPDLKMGKHDLSRRDGHDGILWHEYWLEKFQKEIETRGFLNDF